MPDAVIIPNIRLVMDEHPGRLRFDRLNDTLTVHIPDPALLSVNKIIRGFIDQFLEKEVHVPD